MRPSSRSTLCSIVLVAMLLVLIPIAAVEMRAQCQIEQLGTDPDAVLFLHERGGQQPNDFRIANIRAHIRIDHDVAITRLTARVLRTADAGSVIEQVYLVVPVPHGSEVMTRPEAGGTATSALPVESDDPTGEWLCASRVLQQPNVLEFADEAHLLAGPFTVPDNLDPDFPAFDCSIEYRQRLARIGNRIDYRLPRSLALSSSRLPWSIHTTIQTDDPIAALYSPSHSLDVRKESSHRAEFIVERSESAGSGPHLSSTNGSGGLHYLDTTVMQLDPGDFRLSIQEGDEVQASFISYTDQGSEEGCFVMLVGSGAERTPEQSGVKREIILVIDRSGSMQNEKIEQVRRAARQVLSGLQEEEAFTIVDYADAVTTFSSGPVRSTPTRLQDALAYVDEITADGGTNIHDALVDAVSMDATPGYLPMVIFFTDGLPTEGITEERAIRDAVMEANVHHRRIFTFGVGYDVNAPLLDAIARDARATTTFAGPGEPVDRAVELLFRRLDGPIFSDIELDAETMSGNDATHLVRDMLPTRLHDLYEGEYLSVLGHHRPSEAVVFTLTGSYLGEKRTFRFTFDPAQSRVDDGSYICRLWANRQIMNQVDSIARDGAIPVDERTEEDEQRLRVRTDDIIDLSISNGIVTEYTAFLAEGNADYDEWEIQMEEAAGHISFDSVAHTLGGTKLRLKAQDTRTGSGAASQVMNRQSKSVKAAKANVANTYVNADMEVVSIQSVQQTSDLAFYRRGEVWVDSRMIDTSSVPEPTETLTVGTDEFDAFVREVTAQRRNDIFAVDGTFLVQHGPGIVQVNRLEE